MYHTQRIIFWKCKRPLDATCREGEGLIWSTSWYFHNKIIVEYIFLISSKKVYEKKDFSLRFSKEIVTSRFLRPNKNRKQRTCFYIFELKILYIRITVWEKCSKKQKTGTLKYSLSLKNDRIKNSRIYKKIRNKNKIRFPVSFFITHA